jgi:DNA sulfur modification protein DndB
VAAHEIQHVRRLVAGTRIYYFATLSNEFIDQYTKVLVIEPSADNYVEEDTVHGYQRPASATRQRTIGGGYLKNNPDDVVPPAVLNAAGNWVFSPYEGPGDAGSLSLQGVAHVIDGQHRIGGFIYLWREFQVRRDVDLIVYDNLAVDDERAIFHTINDSQIGVPKAIGAYNMLDVDINWVGWELNEMEESPFRDKISRIGKLGADKLFNLNSVATN